MAVSIIRSGLPLTRHSPQTVYALPPQRSGFLTRRVLRLAVQATTNPAMEVYVKGDPKSQTLGDCPFCHRVLLTLEEKKVPYSLGFIDFSDKPSWLFDVNPKGSVPVAKDLSADKWIVDSGTISDAIEETYPDPQLGTSATIPPIGSGVFPKFVAFLKSSEGDASEKQAALEQELQALEQHLAGSGDFVTGNAVSAADLSLAPKLYHMMVALKHFKGWELPDDCQAVKAYYERLQNRESWKNTLYSEELVQQGWKAHLASAK